MIDKVYVVSYYDNYDCQQTKGMFSTEEKAQQFIEDCKEKFYREGSIVAYDYRDVEFHIDEWELDEWADIIRDNQK